MAADRLARLGCCFQAVGDERHAEDRDGNGRGSRMRRASKKKKTNPQKMKQRNGTVPVNLQRVSRCQAALSSRGTLFLLLLHALVQRCRAAAAVQERIPFAEVGTPGVVGFLGWAFSAPGLARRSAVEVLGAGLVWGCDCAYQDLDWAVIACLVLAWSSKVGKKVGCCWAIAPLELLAASGTGTHALTERDCSARA
jgi:hypothetical protein